MKGIGAFSSVFMVVIGLFFAQAPRYSKASTSAENPAHASLVDMHDGTIYDTDTQLSWLKDAGAGGKKTYDQAVAWAASLNAGSGFGGLKGWRLPNADRDCGSDINCTNSEMGHLYYSELRNKGAKFIKMLTNTGPFTNLQADDYWSCTEDDVTHSDLAWGFSFSGGAQIDYPRSEKNYAWAVRPGARSK
ncbi:MAG: DUF1566 domain-containing protein [Acidobacteriia bacterium]|nr:DUF1566 domain-containing protein [Terriglobia bacterium]